MRLSTPLVALAVALVATVGLGGCAVDVPGEPTSALKSPRTSPKPLPFSPTIKDRTNDRTDGTTFEPCSAFSADELRSLSIDPTTISDAAQIDSANYRGCHWKSIGFNTATGRGFDYSQIVGNKMTLDEYKTKYKDLAWQPNRTAHGRPIAVVASSDYCTAVFTSEFAVVVTIAGQSVDPSPGRTAECDRAIAFATLAITKAPE